MSDSEEVAGSGRMSRRQLLATVGALISLAACGSSADDTAGDGTSGDGTNSDGTSGDGTSGDGTSGDGTGSGECDEIPDETTGPYPDTMDMISNAAYERSDVREDREGVALTLTLSVVEGAACTAVSGAKVMIWHCDKDGVYSEYSNAMNAGSTSTTYLRGWQTTDDAGQVTFQTIYPGWYNPRATHVHVQVYDADGTTVRKTTQLGFTDSLNAEVYGESSLYTKGQNSTTNDTDQVWGLEEGSGTDGGGHDLQIASASGSVTEGITASLVIGLG